MITSSLQKKIDQSIRLLQQVQNAHPDEVIRRDLGETMQNELIWKAKTLALAEIIQKQKYQKFSYVKGYSENDLSFALRHLRILYAYNKRLSEGEYGTNIHAKINGNYKDCMLGLLQKQIK